MTRKPILIVEARFYSDISDLLLAGAEDVLKRKNIEFEKLEVPGALEIPAAIAFTKEQYAAFIALGCVIRGETTHYETVCNESARGLMDLSINHGVALANGILTCENHAQALDRADPAKKNKGASFAETALKMLEIKGLFA
ncbi:MAG: 6,7-dimethyl-8-ribityllumazine synthase [Alphaproteobacteria bacterium]|nr:6,7-dimethyl-8-ribityllumazine synthase [Alphaproteobacteria bacterium]